MDIHRCRFVPYPSSAINALAFSHSSPADPITIKCPSTLRLAVGRANGDIELWNPLNGRWYQESILRGGKGRSIEGLAWTQDPEDVDKKGYKLPGKLRLFSIGCSATVTEWDLALGRPIRHSAGNYSEIWCIAAQSRTQVAATDGTRSNESQSAAQNLIVGCADGSLVLLSTIEDDLRFGRKLARPSQRGARVLCVTFQSSSIVLAGHADSTIRVYDVRNGQQIRNMTLGAGPKDGPKEILVWSLQCLKGDTIVSGDSTGNLCFWNSKNYTLSQRVKAHEADILAISASADGHSLFSGGIDRRTVLCRRMEGNSKEQKQRWNMVTHTRLHKHDLKAMVTYESKGFSILMSGGLDANPIITPIQAFGNESHRTLSSLPQYPLLLSVPQQRLLASWWNNEVRVWTIPSRSHPTSAGSESEDGDDQENKQRMVAKLLLQGEEPINSVDISTDAKLLAVSTATSIKIFQMSQKGSRLIIRKLAKQFPHGALGASILRFSPDAKWLARVTTDGALHIHRVKPETKLDGTAGDQFTQRSMRLRRIPRQIGFSKVAQGTLGLYDRQINQLSFSNNSKILAVADLAGFVDSWILEGQEDLALGSDDNTQVNGFHKSTSHDDDGSSVSSSEEEDQKINIFGQGWIRNPAASLLPKLPATPLVLSFRPSSSKAATPPMNGTAKLNKSSDREDRLFIITSGNRVHEFHISTGRLSDWSRRNPVQSLPHSFQDIRDPAKGVVWDISTASSSTVTESKERIWLYGMNWLWMFDLNQDMSVSDQVSPPSQRQTSTSNGFTPHVHSLKRKREADTGAGSLIRPSEVITGAGIGRTIQRIDGDNEDNKSIKVIDFASRKRKQDLQRRQKRAIDKVDGDDIDDDDSDDDSEVLETDIEDATKVNQIMKISSPSTEILNTTTDNHDSEKQNNGVKTRGPSNWGTLKYRPILGIVPLGRTRNRRRPFRSNLEKPTNDAEHNQDQDHDHDQANGNLLRIEGRKEAAADELESTQDLVVGEQDDRDDDDDASEGDILEVALVERPLWDMDLPPKFYGKKEWDDMS